MFIFECRTHNLDCLVLFLGQYVESSKKILTTAIQEAYAKNLIPETVLIIYPQYLQEQVSELFKESLYLLEILRHQLSPVVGVSFDINCNLAITHDLNSTAPFTHEFDLSVVVKDVIKAGYHHLVTNRRNDILVKSPTGTTFVKPSGKTLDEFIYASQLARTNYEHQFLAMSLLKHAPDLDKVDCIFIDTSSISAIAEATIYYITQFKHQNCKHITYCSFSSYSGLEINKPDNSKGAWVVISASASTSLGKKIKNEWGLLAQQVITILSYQEVLSAEELKKNEGNNIVFSLKDFFTVDKNSFSPIKVQIQGENFAAEVSDPHKITLLKKFKPNFIDKSIFKYRNISLFSNNKTVNSDDRSKYVLHVNYEELSTFYLNQEKNALHEWMKQVIQWTVPRNLSAIISKLGTSSDKLLLKDFQSVLVACGFTDSISVIDPQDSASAPAKLDKIGDGAVLVLSTAISSGRFFIDVNRELRLAHHKGMRIFATPFVIAPSRSQHQSMTTSLTQGTNNFKYPFTSYQTIYAGDKSSSSWVKELDLIKILLDTIDEETSPAVDFWVDRKLSLEKTGDGLEGRIGLHFTNPNQHLPLAPDFVFWPEYNAENVKPEAVYATVVSILQHIRDVEFNGLKLSGNIYQHCVLDPENFVRFNDPLLQSCLWRCALPRELDYRRSDSLSNDMHSILRKIFISKDSARGLTAIDFLIALAIRWIKLTNDSLKAVLDDASKYLTEPQATPLIKYMKDHLLQKSI